MTEPTKITDQVEQGRNVCRAALRNLIGLCQINLGGRSHHTTTDVRVEDFIWKILNENFGDATRHESSGDHIPQSHRPQAPPAIISAVDKIALERIVTSAVADKNDEASVTG